MAYANQHFYLAGNFELHLLGFKQVHETDLKFFICFKTNVNINLNHAYLCLQFLKAFKLCLISNPLLVTIRCLLAL